MVNPSLTSLCGWAQFRANNLDKKKYILWDLAGSKNYRKVWHSYIEESDIILFFIDGSNQTNAEEVRTSIRDFLADLNIQGKKIVFYINKNVNSDYSFNIRIERSTNCYSIRT